ncbi:MAG: hypothetical protein GY765_16385, partial [bacterium]|nr:hypothetical protein [bacterium]
LPDRLAEEIRPLTIFYHTKPDLTLKEILALKKGGITDIQPGTESLSLALLRRMHKPTDVRKNINTLRYGRSAGLKVGWNLLFGFPGDQVSDYRDMIDLLPFIRHLEPPKDMLPMVLCKNSRYYNSPGEYGITRLRPGEVYRDILPPQSDLFNIANLYASDFPSQSRENPGVLMELWEEFRQWISAWSTFESMELEMFLPILK